MPQSLPGVSRRTFLSTSAVAAAGTLAGFGSARRRSQSTRASAWTTSPCARWGGRRSHSSTMRPSLALDSLFITDLDAFESFDEAPLRALREYAAARRLQIQVGTWSICPTSKAFKPKWGTADEHLALGIRVARALGSPVIRVVLGTWEDRLTDGGIDRHIERDRQGVPGGSVSRAVDAGVKIAVENHAGDMHSTELLRLVEAAGTDYVGVNFDSGNALWTLEDPIDSSRKPGQVHPDDEPARLGGVGVRERRAGRLDGDGRGHARSARVLRAVPRALPQRRRCTSRRFPASTASCRICSRTSGRRGPGCLHDRSRASKRLPVRVTPLHRGSRPPDRTRRGRSRVTSEASWSGRSCTAATSCSSGPE